MCSVLGKCKCLTHSHMKLNGMRFFFSESLNNFLFSLALRFRTSKVKVSVMEGFVALKEDALESCSGLVHAI